MWFLSNLKRSHPRNPHFTMKIQRSKRGSNLLLISLPRDLPRKEVRRISPTPKNIKPHATQKLPLSPKLRNQTVEHAVDLLTQERLMIQLLAHGSSPNEIQAHFFNVFWIHRKYSAIRKVLLARAHNVRRINNLFDRIASSTVTILEMDETFKGRQVSLLIVVDTLTGYIILIRWLPERSKNALLDVLLPLKELFKNVKLVLTDGAPYFPEVIQELCPQAQHQRCLIHIMRDLFPKLQNSKKAWHHALKNWHNALEEIKDLTAHHKARGIHFKKLHQQERYWKAKRAEIHTRSRIKANQKGILNRIPVLKKINAKINEVRVKVRSIQRTFAFDKKRIKTAKNQAKLHKYIVDQSWTTHMKEVQILYRFYSLFQSKPEDFITVRSTLIIKLAQQPPTDLINAILRILTDVKSVDSIYTKNCPVRLSRNFINTNVIESINSRLRPLLDKFKKICNTEYSAAFFDTVRLRLNASAPYSGRRKSTAPIERYGYFLRGRTWLDLIFDGLPPGPQWGKNRTEPNLALACPDRKDFCIISPISLSGTN